MRKVQESSHFGSLSTPRRCSRIADFVQKECSRTKKLTSLDIPTQIEIRHVLFIRKGDN